MIGKRWAQLNSESIKLLLATLFLITVGTILLSAGLTNEISFPFNAAVGLGFVILVAAGIFSILIANVGYKRAIGKSLTEKDLVEDDIYKLIGPLVSYVSYRECIGGESVFYGFLQDREGYIGAFRLSKPVPSRFQVVGKGDSQEYKPYPSEPEPEPEG